VAKELEEERERKHAEHGDGHRRKKKKVRVEPELDEDDLDLIKDNTGIEIRAKKKKRLQKWSEKEQADEAMESNVKEDPDEHLFHEDKAGGESDQEMIDTSRKRVFKPAGTKKNYFDPTSLNYIDPDKVHVARQIFDSKPNLEEKLRQRLEAEAIEDLEEMFDANEIDDQFATKQDKIIAEIDIPERIQLLIGEKYLSFHNLICYSRYNPA
jgi:hypothetical protein